MKLSARKSMSAASSKGSTASSSRDRAAVVPPLVWNYSPREVHRRFSEMSSVSPRSFDDSDSSKGDDSSRRSSDVSHLLEDDDLLHFQKSGDDSCDEFALDSAPDRGYASPLASLSGYHQLDVLDDTSPVDRGYSGTAMSPHEQLSEESSEERSFDGPPAAQVQMIKRESSATNFVKNEADLQVELLVFLCIFF